MRKIARLSVILLGTAIAGPALATAASATTPEVRFSEITDDRRSARCILCWL